MPRKHLLAHLFLLGVTLSVLVGCRAAPAQEDPTIAESASSPGETGNDARPLAPPSGPPTVENDAPAGICENTANLLSRVDRVSGGLFRAVALDNRVGENDGDGIRGVRFAVTGDNLDFSHDEVTAPYCIFGSNEPDCGEWPRDSAGQYTWGVDGSPVRSGRYEVFVEVFGQAPDSLSGRDRCSWSFLMEVALD